MASPQAIPLEQRQPQPAPPRATSSALHMKWRFSAGEEVCEVKGP